MNYGSIGVGLVPQDMPARNYILKNSLHLISAEMESLRLFEPPCIFTFGLRTLLDFRRLNHSKLRNKGQSGH